MGSSLVLNRRPKVPAEDTAAFGAIAERFRRAGALEQAVSLCRDGLKKFPDHVSARVTLGWSLLDLGKYDEARVELEQVMRRAPDNLAAIRGLAELHDRFEHTLNLPMDGPGQWPPPAESVDGEAPADYASTIETTDATISERFETEEPAASESEFAEPAMAPAAMGLPLWTPDRAPSPAAAVESAPIAATHSGMSSVREIDAFAGATVPNVEAEAVVAPEPEIEAPVVAIATDEAVTEEMDLELGVTDDALAALIAEADSLDAAAAMEVVAAPDALELGSVEVELDTAAPLEAVELDAVAPMAGVELDTVAPLEAVELETASPMEFEAVTEDLIEQAVVAMVEPVVEEALEPAISEVAPEVAATAEVLAFVARPTPVAESVELEPMELLQDEQEEPVQAIAMPSKNAAAAAKVEALERMLRRVQTRRRQLMAESVA